MHTLNYSAGVVSHLYLLCRMIEEVRVEAH